MGRQQASQQVHGLETAAEVGALRIIHWQQAQATLALSSIDFIYNPEGLNAVFIFRIPLAFLQKRQKAER